MTRRIFVLAASLLAIACGGDAPDRMEADVDPYLLADRIETVAELEESDPPPPPRLAALADADIPPEFRAGSSCRLRQGDRLLLLATPLGAVVRADGRVARLRLGAPAGPSGGFFEAPGVTVSIGRRDGAGAGDRGAASPAGATVGGDPKRPIERLIGTWACFP